MTDLKETLDALDDPANADWNIELGLALFDAYRSGHLIVKPDRELLREKVMSDMQQTDDSNYARGIYRDSPKYWRRLADAALTATFGDEA